MNGKQFDHAKFFRWVTATPGLLLVALGCGTFVGNPKKPQPTDPTPVQREIALPEIELTIPDEFVTDSDLGLSLRASNPMPLTALKSSLHSQMLATKRAIATLNFQIRKLNRAGLFLNRRYEKQDGNTQFTGIIRSIDTIDHGLEFTYCRNDEPFFHMSWEPDSGQVTVHRDFSVNETDAPYGAATLFSRLQVKRTESGIKIQLQNQGRPWIPPAVEVDGEFYVEALEVEKNQDNYKIRSVSDWRADESQAGSFEGEYYLVGGIKTNPLDWGMLSWRKRKCDQTFDENAETPQWCIGSKKEALILGSVMRNMLWNNQLKDIGVLKASSLEHLAMPETVLCPD